MGVNPQARLQNKVVCLYPDYSLRVGLWQSKLEKASVVCEPREADMLLLKQSDDIWMRGDSVADATTSA